MAGQMRMFIALQPPAVLRAAIWQGFAPVRTLAPRARWVSADNIHLTLKFLGDVDAGALPSLDVRLGQVAADHSPFDVLVAGAGTFPAGGRARVIWGGTVTGQDEAVALARAVDRTVSHLGFEPERRPMQTHLTVARVGPDGLSGAAHAAIAGLRAVSWGGFSATEMLLMQSLLRPAGPIYSVVERYPLTGGRLAP